MPSFLVLLELFLNLIIKIEFKDHTRLIVVCIQNQFISKL